MFTTTKSKTGIDFTHNNEDFIVNQNFRKLSENTDFYTKENVRTVNGQIPLVSCPLGYYRLQVDHNPLTVSSQRQDGCVPCSRGKYGDTMGLVTYRCTGVCPAGKYSDQVGLKSKEECKLCPPGTYGSQSGLKTSKCTKKCPPGRYSDTYGNTELSSCKICPPNYFQWQCKYEISISS
mmetsp:Transcript_7599/g.11343  ORF Transcript_7599/g.11343 Transcript_7599/m.11343 type:complete len:178 (+) Transcript_7599:147-680(+)